MDFLKKIDVNRCGLLIEQLENTYLRENATCYPEDINITYDLLLIWKADLTNFLRVLQDRSYDAVSVFKHPQKGPRKATNKS